LLLLLLLLLLLSLLMSIISSDLGLGGGFFMVFFRGVASYLFVFVFVVIVVGYLTYVSQIGDGHVFLTSPRVQTP